MSRVARTAIVFRVAHIVEGRDTAEMLRILAVCRALGFVPRAEYLARPYTVPKDERIMPSWCADRGAPPVGDG